ncbi:dihydroorotate dehydrogenase [Nocardioides mesophilus]|uniref:Dihydroorotate dehydrogenase n=1 Tax=Nocardioides mesophilus TaxID=433659 RepID=A0A7G9RHT7_9ACTN|nr:dihydroorotate dehydrogenase [Nocardioides mesophilus]
MLGTRLATPLLTAAGCGGTGRELEPHLDLTTLGAFTTRSLTLDASPGAPAPRLVETASGVLWNTGGQNPGLQGFLASELPWLAQRQVRVVVSLAGGTPGEYAELARRLGNAPGVWGLELNLATANREDHGRRFCDEAYHAGKAVAAVREALPRTLPVLAKLAPGPGLVDVAGVVARAGADAVVLVHGAPGLAFDPTTWRPALGTVAGTVSGPAVLAQALRCVWQVHAALPQLPVIGAGGVRSGFDVVQMLLSGARAVELGTALLREPAAPVRIAEELREELLRHGTTDLAGLIGAGHTTSRGEPR